MTEDPPPVSGYAAGSRIGGYLLEEQIGHGGMAVVFRALDERLGRRVALKILAPALAADEAFRQRFIRESRAAAAMDDPHIIPLFEAGEAGRTLFIAMRLVGGGDVRSLIHREGALPPERVAAIVSQVASALDAAHGAGLVHRDVKPANMLLDTRQGRADHVYLSDFGLTKAAGGATGLTGTGLFLGTADYAAPEQVDGRPVDGRTDQYSLGCAAFEMLCGEPPFRRDLGLAVLLAHRSEPPPPVTSRRPGLPGAADAVVARALAKSPDDRFPSCGEFAAALREALGVAPYAAVSDPGLAHPGTALADIPSRPEELPGATSPGWFPFPEEELRSTRGGQPGRTGGGQETMRRDRGRWPVAIVSAAAAAAIVAIGAAALVLASRPSQNQGSSGPTGTASGGGPSATASTGQGSPAASGTPVSTSATATATAASTAPSPSPSWTTYTDPSGFSVNLPAGWSVSSSSANEVRFTGSPPGFVVVVAWTYSPQPDALTDWQQQAAAKSASDPTYHEIRVEQVSYRGYNAADWEFTNGSQGGRTHVLDRTFIVSPGHLAYAVELYGPDDQWQSVYPGIWNELMTSFQPAS